MRIMRNDADPGYDAAPPAPAFTLTKEGPRTVIEATAGDDKITIDQNRHGDLIVSDAQGRSVKIPKADVDHGVVVRGGRGNDDIIATDRVTRRLILDGGAGDDRIQGGAGNDEIFGGDGKNIIYGRGGDDYLEGGKGVDEIDGGDGCDVIYGLGGDDVLWGGAQRDYIDGGEGADHLRGEGGDDMLIGGKGADFLQGAAGKDVLAGGSGKDVHDGGAGADRIYSQHEDTAHLDLAEGDRAETVAIDPSAGKSVTVTGTERFKARVASDFEAWRSLPNAADLLNELDRRAAATRKAVTIVEQKDPMRGSVAEPTDPDPMRAMRNPDHSRDVGSNARITYNPVDRELKSGDAANFIPPSVELYHEAVHAHDQVHGNLPYSKRALGIGETDGDSNHERKAIGLPFDHDGDPKTPHEAPGRFHENLMREKLGLPLRSHHGDRKE